jgi:hypothetical protein
MLTKERLREAGKPLTVVAALRQRHQDVALRLAVSPQISRVKGGRLLRPNCFHSTNLSSRYRFQATQAGGSTGVRNLARNY